MRRSVPFFRAVSVRRPALVTGLCLLFAVFAGARLVPPVAPVFFAVALAAVLTDREPLVGVFLPAGFFVATGGGVGASGFGAPNFSRTGLSPQISSRW